MAINGNLTDLSLVDLLQTIALSRKSGLLEICGDGDVAWIGVAEGGITRIGLSEKVVDLDLALKAAGLDGNASQEDKERVVWDAAIRTILPLFDWDEGEFRFEPGDTDALWMGPEGLRLPTHYLPSIWRWREPG